MKQQHTERIRFDGLDVLRGFAAAIVVFIHVWALGGFGGLGVRIDEIVGGYFGMAVPLFYALSAFALLYGYDRTFFDELTMKKFYIRRFFRLAPLFYILLLVNIIQLYILYGIKIDLTRLLLNITFLFSIVPSQQESIVPAGWSIGIEWIFYFLFPLVVLISRSKIFLWITTIILLIISLDFPSLTASVVESSPSLNYINIVKHLVFFLIGALVYKTLPLIQSIGDKFKRVKKIDLLYVILILYLFYFLSRFARIEILEAALFILLLSWAIVGPSKLFNNKFTRVLGKCSYGLYLLNPLVIDHLSRLHFYDYVRDLFANTSHAALYSFVISCFVSLLIITLLSLASYHFIEQPCIKIGNRLINKVSNSKQESIQKGKHLVR